MDIRYFGFLDRLKRGDESEIRLRGETDNHTRLLTGELGVQIPPGAQIPPHLLRGAENDDAEKAARRARIVRVICRAEQEGLYDQAEHVSNRACAAVGDEKVKVKMAFVVDKFDANQGRVTCPCGAEFDDWATLWHTCPECGAIDEGV